MSESSELELRMETTVLPSGRIEYHFPDDQFVIHVDPGKETEFIKEFEQQGHSKQECILAIAGMSDELDDEWITWEENWDTNARIEALTAQLAEVTRERDEAEFVVERTRYLAPCGHHGWSCDFCGIVSKKSVAEFPHSDTCSMNNVRRRIEGRSK